MPPLSARRRAQARLLFGPVLRTAGSRLWWRESEVIYTGPEPSLCRRNSHRLGREEIACWQSYEDIWRFDAIATNAGKEKALGRSQGQVFKKTAPFSNIERLLTTIKDDSPLSSLIWRYCCSKAATRWWGPKTVVCNIRVTTFANDVINCVCNSRPLLICRSSPHVRGLNSCAMDLNVSTCSLSQRWPSSNNRHDRRHWTWLESRMGCRGHSRVEGEAKCVKLAYLWGSCGWDHICYCTYCVLSRPKVHGYLLLIFTERTVYWLKELRIVQYLPRPSTRPTVGWFSCPGVAAATEREAFPIMEASRTNDQPMTSKGSARFLCPTFKSLNLVLAVRSNLAYVFPRCSKPSLLLRSS